MNLITVAHEQAGTVISSSADAGGKATSSGNPHTAGAARRPAAGARGNRVFLEQRGVRAPPGCAAPGSMDSPPGERLEGETAGSPSQPETGPIEFEDVAGDARPHDEQSGPLPWPLPADAVDPEAAPPPRKPGASTQKRLFKYPDTPPGSGPPPGRGVCSVARALAGRLRRVCCGCPQGHRL